MPNYDFKCPSCGEVFEENLLISERDRDDVHCPKCGHEGAKRLVSAPNIGSGRGGNTIPISAPT
jgi:putative FmdB family regulatory protein